MNNPIKIFIRKTKTAWKLFDRALNKIELKLSYRYLLFLLDSFSWYFKKYFQHIPKTDLEPLKKYLTLNNKFHQSFIAQYTIPLFGGLHPKNVFNYRYEFFLDHVNSKDVVVDIGCGTGLILNKIQHRIKHGYGLDYDKENINLCNKYHSSEKLEFLEADILTFDYNKFQANTNYNTAIISHLLEHVGKPVELLKKINAKKVLICVPSQENWIQQLRIFLKLPYFLDPTHQREYTRKMLIDELISAGYYPVFMGFNSEGELIAEALRVDEDTKDEIYDKYIKNIEPRVAFSTINFVDPTSSGKLKILDLMQHIVNHYDKFNIVYMLSGELPENLEEWIKICKDLRIKIIVNQNGVWYKAVAGGNKWFTESNNKMKQALEAADFVFFQSKFSKECVEKFITKLFHKSTVLYNSVDTSIYKPLDNKAKNEMPVILNAGNFSKRYRFDLALNTLNHLIQKGVLVKLRFAGKFKWSNNAQTEALEAVSKLNLENYVEFCGEYDQDKIIQIMQTSDLLLHTQFNDVCPRVVLEAMATKLPVIYSNTGGTHELVGDCGIGVGDPEERHWEVEYLPEPEKLAAAIIEVLQDLDKYSIAARNRAVKLFDIKDWVDNHIKIFNDLITEK